jgi:NAD(P)-dependent dehydrogenase (short-subunit alcohol dehydrogenase family)
VTDAHFASGAEDRHPPRDRQLEGEVAVVTGGNGGIGLGLARGLALAGADVCIWGRDRTKNLAASVELRQYGTRVEAFVCDVSNETEVVSTFERTLQRLGKVDACFANAGRSSRLVSFVDLDLETWRRTFAVNLDGAMLTLREAARHMVTRNQGGSLIAVSSTSAIHGAPRNHAYAASKTGLLALTRSLAVELARYGIRCNSLLPGWTDTDMLSPGRTNKDFVEATTHRTPVRRWANPDEFGAVAVYLARRDLTFHTGDELVVDGGYTRY